jgi:hypothetical protein
MPTDLAAVPPDQISEVVLGAEEVNLIEFAANKLRAECMTERGYPQLEETGVRKTQPPFSDLDSSIPRFATVSEEEARVSGFGENQRAEYPHVVSYDRSFDEAFETCSTAASETIGRNAAETKSRVYQLYNDIVADRQAAQSSAKEERRIGGIRERFLDCLDSAGFRGRGRRDLDAYNIGRPVGTLEGAEPAIPKRIPGTVIVIPAIPARRYVPTPEESRLAVAAVRCSRRTGLGDRLGEQRARLLRNALQKHETEIAELRPQIAQLGKAAAAVVAR